MNELETLLDKYPKMFNLQSGFECKNGWYNIIDQLCQQIQSHINWAQRRREYEVQQGIQGEPGMPRTPHVEQVVAMQVKEKFGTLRFYYDGGDQYISGLVSMAEAMSSVTCEVCGSPGKIRGHHWIYTACDKHEEI